MKNRILLAVGVLFITLCSGAQSPNQQLQKLVGTWKAVESTFTNPPQGIVKVVPAANGGAIYSTWTQGSDDTYYEANALWGYSELYKQVRVFEVNTIGVASTNVGNFDDTGVLTLEVRDPNTNEIMEERIMNWTENTWEMKVRFIVNGNVVKHYAKLIRQNKADYTKEEAAIREVWNKTSEYLAKKDWQNYSKCYDQTEKLQIIHPQTPQWLNGWEEFSSAYKPIVERKGNFIEYENELLNVNISRSGDMAWANAKVVWSWNNPENKIHMWYAMTFNKVDGEWEIVMAMACSVPNSEL